MKHCVNPDCEHRRRFGRIAEYRDDCTECSDCGEGLAPGEAPSPDRGRPEFLDLVTIYEPPEPVRGHLLRGILESRGIPAFVIGDALTGAIGELPATVLQVRVQVPREFSFEAAEVAESFERGELEA